jgi:F-type H+-transporting ATPase subunit b
VEDIGKWQMLLTHAVGFLIALWILKKFAWQPILNILEERRQKIQSDFDEAAEDRKKSEKLLADYEEKLKEIDAEARKKIQEAVREGQQVATEIKDSARQESRELIEKAKSELQRDVEKAKVQLKEDLVKMTIGATEKLILERLDEQKHRQLITNFIDDVEKA